MNVKRVISSITSVLVCMTSISSCFTTYAFDTPVEGITIEGNEISVNNENSLGSLFSDKIDEQLKERENIGNSITSVEINEKTAVVNYSSLVDCIVVVGIYDDTGSLLLGSGKNNVYSEQNTVSVEIDIDVLPEYFYLKAYLIDSLEFAPLSEVYENPNYTSKMKEFFSKTTSDFEEERVINFDDDATNNFAVFSENVIVLEEREGSNIVTTCDNENGVYVFENADETILSLTSGDILSYDYGDGSEFIIAKVNTISIDGTTVTIAAAETDIEEVFEYVRIDEQAEQSEAQYDTEGIPNVLESDFSNLDHSDEYENNSNNNTPEVVDDTTFKFNNNINLLKDVDYDIDSDLELEIDKGKAEVSKKDTVKITFADENDSYDDKNANVKFKADIFNGTLLYTSTLSLKLYFSDIYESEDLNLNNNSGLINYFEIKWEQSVSITGKAGVSLTKEYPLFSATYAIGYGFYITIEPKFIIGGDAELELDGCLTETLGFKIENGESKSISEKPKFSSKIKSEGTFYIGIDIGPTIKWISKHLGCVETEISAKVKITSESDVDLKEIGGDGKPKDKHECNDDILQGIMEGCIDGRIDFIVTIAGTGKILNNDKLKLELKAELNFHLKDFYYSITYDEFNWGKCPHKLYHYQLEVKDSSNTPIKGADVRINIETIKTDDKGIAHLYFSEGENDIVIEHDDYDNFSETYTVKIKRKTTSSNSSSTSTDGSNLSVNLNGKFNETADIVTINGSEERSSTIKLRHKTHKVKVNVVDSEGEPVRNVKIQCNFKSDYYTTEGRTGFNGTYILRIPNGEWIISASTGGYASTSEIITVEDADTEITLTITENPCIFTVTDQYGDPVNGAKLLFTNTETGESVSSLVPTTDENGLYAYSFNVGEYEFTATRKGYDDYEGSFTVPEGGIEVDVEMYCNLRKATVIVEDENENSLSGVSVKSYYDNNSYITDDNGTVIIKLPVGETELRFIKDGYYTSKSYLTINEGEDITATFQLETITGDNSSSGATWTFDKYTGVLTISGTGATGTVGDIYYDDEIKSVIIEDGITSIGSSAFKYCNAITAVTIPDSVTSIGEDAFYGCDSLTEITIPDSVTSIGSSAFSGCTGLTEITIPDSVTSIGSGAFSGCSIKKLEIGDGSKTIKSSMISGLSQYFGFESQYSGLENQIEEVVIPNSVTSIEERAFYHCNALTTITIPDSVTSIGSGAFSGCTGLTEITISDSVTSIGSGAFAACTGLTEIIIPDSVTSIGERAFYGCTALTSITINDSVTSIGEYAFYDCTGLTEIIIPDSVTSIGVRAFSWCTALTSITIPDSVTSIGSGAFYGCTALTSITIPNSVTSIGESAFYECDSLTEITIPDSVTSIGKYAFSGCDALTTLIIADGSQTVTSEMTNYLEDRIKKVIIPDSVTSIGSSAFENCTGLTEITIPDSVTSIGSSAFENCTGLTEITIPDSTSIGEHAFYGCTGLTEITIPDSVTSIAKYAFSGCNALTTLIIADGSQTVTSEMTNDLVDRIKKVIIPDSVTSIGSSAFENCTGLTEITIPDSVTSIGSSAFENCTGLTEITIPDSVTSIGDSAFYGCDSLTEITIPDSVTSIGEYAFCHCTALTSITISDSVTSIGSGAFSGCTGLTEITIPDSVTSIGERAFYRCTALTSITISDSVTSIGSGAFYGCTGLTEITIPDCVTSIGEDAFYGCTGLTEITIPDCVTSIGEDAFYGCTGLTEITIPDSVTSIGDSAFYGCDSLTEITIPDSVTSIGKYVFSSCDGLTSITIPDSVTSIKNNAFSYCDALTTLIIADGSQTVTFLMTSGLEEYIKKVIIPNSVTSIGDNAFYNYDGLTSITIPDSVTSIGSYAFEDCKSLTSIIIPDSVTSIRSSAFYNSDRLKNVYYTGTKEQWAAISIGYCYALQKADIHYNYTPEESSIYTLGNLSNTEVFSKDENNKKASIVPLTTSSTTTTTTTSETTTTTITTATTTIIEAVYIDLEPNRIYNFYAVRSTEAEDLLSAENLIYMSQGTADENGMLSFGYLPKEEGVKAEHVIVGMIYCIEHAGISVENMEYTGTELAAEVIVTNDGETLVEGTDYTLSGTLSTTKPGIYEVKVSGIGDYYGDKYVYYTVTCEHEYAGGICTICETQCVHSYEDGICTVCGEVMPVTTTSTTTTTTTTTSTTTTSTTTTTTTKPITTTSTTTTSSITTTSATITTPIVTTPLETTELDLGDVDHNKKINAVDASMILAEYAILATNGKPNFTEEQMKSADVNEDGNVNAFDASLVLAYYAHISTGGKSALKDFILSKV